MASSTATVDYILKQIADAGAVRARKMFGEYGVYCDDIFIGVICDDTFFVKPTPQGTALAPDLGMSPAYDGAKPSLKITADLLEDADRLSQLVRVTASALAD